MKQVLQPEVHELYLNEINTDSDKFSSHSRDISLEVGAEVVRDFTGDEGTYGTLDGDVTRVKILFTGDNVSL
jgi:hypothetical protein